MCECAWSGGCPWAHGCRRERLSCSQMLQDTAPMVPSVSREDYENSFQCCCAVLFTLLSGCELWVKKQINQTKGYLHVWISQCKIVFLLLHHTPIFVPHCLTNEWDETEIPKLQREEKKCSCVRKACLRLKHTNYPVLRSFPSWSRVWWEEASQWDPLTPALFQ